jgi:histidyl-tRNA synthetase
MTTPFASWTASAKTPRCWSHYPFHGLLSALDSLGIPYHLNHRLVRGLDYYTKTVFEVISEDLGAQNALLGGGRYDYLVRHLGGPAIPAVGWGLGLERLTSVLATRYPELVASLTLPRAYIVHSEAAAAAAFELRRTLTGTGWAMDIDVRQDGFGKQVARASKRGARLALILGEDELASGTVTVKNLISGSQSTIPMTDVASRLVNATTEQP